MEFPKKTIVHSWNHPLLRRIVKCTSQYHQINILIPLAFYTQVFHNKFEFVDRSAAVDARGEKTTCELTTKNRT